MRAPERAVGIAVEEGTMLDDIAAELLVQYRSIGCDCRFRLDDRRQRSVLHVNQIDRIFRNIAARCHYYSHGFAKVTHAIDGTGIKRDPISQHVGDRLCHGSYIDAGENADNARQLFRSARIDTKDLGMSVRRAQDGGVPEPRQGREVIDKARLSFEQRGILTPWNALADPLLRVIAHRGGYHTA